MDRRCILKMIGSTIVVSALPIPSILKAGEKPFPEWMRKQGALYFVDLERTSKEEAKKVLPLAISRLKAHAEATLPTGSPYDIREAIPGNFGTERAIAWMYTPQMLYSRIVNADCKPVVGEVDTFILTQEFGLPYVTDWEIGPVNKMSVPDGCFIIERCRT